MGAGVPGSGPMGSTPPWVGRELARTTGYRLPLGSHEGSRRTASTSVVWKAYGGSRNRQGVPAVPLDSTTEPLELPAWDSVILLIADPLAAKRTSS